MKSTRRSAKLFASFAAASLIFAACGGSDDDGGDGDTDTTEGAQGTDAPTETTDGGDDTTATTEGGDEPAATTAAPTEEDMGASGGTLVWAHEQEPPDLHLDDPNNNLSITSWIRSALLEGLYGISGSNEYYPELLAGEAEITENADGTVTESYVLRDGLMWSDGEPLTSADVEFTYNVIMASDGTVPNDGGTPDDTSDDTEDPNYIYLIGDRSAYASPVNGITSVEATSDTEFTINRAAFFAGYPAALPEIYPAHIFSADPVEAAGQINDALRNWEFEGTVLPASGPMIFDSWQKGVQMNMVRNDSYHGSNSPDAVNKGVAAVDGVQINFVTDTDAQINALLAGEAQIVMTQPQLAFEQLSSNADFTVASSAGAVYEHWSFNLFNVHLAKPEVREALAYAMDKTEVMEALYTPLFGDSLPAAGLGNTYWMSNQDAYEDHAGDAGYGKGDVAAAQAALESAGYTMNADGIYEHPEDGVLSLRVGTTGGNRLREIQEELVQAQMADAGIDVQINNVEGGAYFSEQPFSPDSEACFTSAGAEGNCDLWDIAQFAWVGGPWPGGTSPNYRTATGNNLHGYSNADFDAMADQCDATVDDDERSACYNELDKYATTLTVDPNGLVLLPITQKPSFYGYTSALETAGVAPDAQNAGPLTNVADFSFAG